MGQNNSNRGALNAQLSKINDWDYAEGDFDFDDAFGDNSEVTPWNSHSEAAGDNNQYHGCKVKKPVSMPYLYQVNNSSTAQNVNMFGAETALYISGFNNTSGSISFNWLLTGYYSGGAAGYAAFLQRTIAQTFSIGRIRMEIAAGAVSSQLAVPLNISDFDPTGKSISYPAIQFAKLNQFITFAVETELDMTVYGGTQVSYFQFAGAGTSSPWVVTWYLWAADVASLTRALEGKPAFKELRRPDTYLNQTIRFERQHAPKKLAQ